MAVVIPFDSALSLALANPNDTSAVAELGLRAIDERREREALALIASALSAAPRDQTLLHVKGLLHRALGEMPAAMAALDAAFSAGAPTPRLAQARALTALEAGLPATRLYAQARALAPLEASAILGEAAAMTAEGQDEAADALLSRTLQENPGWFDGHTALARARYAAGRPDYLAALDQAITGAPRDFSLWQVRIAILHRAREHEAEAEAIAEARRRFGDSEALAAADAMLAAERGDAADGDAAFATLDLFSQTALMIHWLRHQIRQGRPERVMAMASRFVTRADVNEAWPYLSIAMRMTGDARIAWLEDVERFVRVTDIPMDAAELEALAGSLRALHLARAQPLDQSVRGGTQTDGPLFQRTDPTIRRLRGRIEAEIAAYVAALPEPIEGHPLLGKVPVSPRFIGSWSVRLSGGGHHDPHLHPYGWLSSAFYVAVPDVPAGSEEGYLTLGEPQAMLRSGLAPYRTVKPEPGRLVLFPSTMWHGTRPFGAGERLTVAFDVG